MDESEAAINQHERILMEAFTHLSNGVGSESRIRLISKERVETCIRRDLLTFHSVEMRGLVVSVSRTIAGAAEADLVIHMPDFSAGTLGLLRNLLETGTHPGPVSQEDVLTVREAAGCLGVDLGQLEQGGVVFSRPGQVQAPLISSTISVKQEMFQQEEEEPVMSDFTVQEPADTSYVCRVCKTSCRSAKDLKSHYVLHYKKDLTQWIDNSMTKCLECNKTFSRSNKILLHVGLEHGKLDEILAREEGTEGGRGTPSDPRPARLKTKSRQAPQQRNLISSYLQQTPSSIEIKPSRASTPDAPLSLTMDPPSVPETVTLEVSSQPGPSTPSEERERTPRSGSLCNYSLQCELCQFKAKQDYQLEEHMCVKHFSRELGEAVRQFISPNMSCIKCGDEFKHKKRIEVHLGCKHGLINEVLRQKNLMVLPSSVNINYSAKKQKKLKMIKQEKVESNEPVSHEEIKRQLLMDTESEGEGIEKDVN